MIFRATRNRRALARARASLDRGDLDEALAFLRRALTLQEANAVTHNLIGMVLRDKGDASGAETHLRRALALDACLADAHINLGAVLSEQGRVAEAEKALRRAVAEDPANAIGWCNLGLILAEQGSPLEADQCFQCALRAEPGYFYARLALVMNKLREIYDSTAELERSRAEYAQALHDLRNWLPSDAGSLAAAAGSVGWITPFFLAYQGRNDRELQRTYGSMVCELMARRHPDLAAAVEAPSPNGRLRIGIVSGFFYDHSVWKNPIRGWLEHLDRAKFEVYGYYTGMRQDADTAAARAACARFVEAMPFEAMARKIRADRLHVVVFPEIGMDATTVKLAALRLAPVQCTSWGHPTTCGLRTVDYFLSSERMEPDDGDAHYSERLVRLPNLSVHYTPPAYARRDLQRGDLGLRPGAAAFFCAQSLFKYLPQDDALFPRIARQLGDSQFLFIASQRSAVLTERFRQRLGRAFTAEGLDPRKHLVILPRMDGSTFQAVARACDVFLDNIGWSGCNSTLESMAAGLVPVTCAGDTMRGRHTFAILKMMQLDELIADDFAAYVELATRLASDAGWRSRVQAKMVERLPRVFGDLDCIKGLEAFLQSASASAHTPAPSARA